MTNAQLKNSIWRVPLICLIAGLLYIRCYVWIVLRFGVLAPGEINDTVGLLTDAAGRCLSPPPSSLCTVFSFGPFSSSPAAQQDPPP